MRWYSLLATRPRAGVVVRSRCFLLRPRLVQVYTRPRFQLGILGQLHPHLVPRDMKYARISAPGCSQPFPSSDDDGPTLGAMTDVHWTLEIGRVAASGGVACLVALVAHLLTRRRDLGGR